MTEKVKQSVEKLVPVALWSLCLLFALLATSWTLDSTSSPAFPDLTSPWLAGATAIAIGCLTRWRKWFLYRIAGLLIVVSISVRAIYILQMMASHSISPNGWRGLSQVLFLLVSGALLSRTWDTDVRRWMEEEGT